MHSASVHGREISLFAPPDFLPLLPPTSEPSAGAALAMAEAAELRDEVLFRLAPTPW